MSDGAWPGSVHGIEKATAWVIALPLPNGALVGSGAGRVATTCSYGLAGDGVTKGAADERA